MSETRCKYCGEKIYKRVNGWLSCGTYLCPKNTEHGGIHEPTPPEGEAVTEQAEEFEMHITPRSVTRIPIPVEAPEIELQKTRKHVAALLVGIWPEDGFDTVEDVQAELKKLRGLPPRKGNDARFKEHHLGCPVCSEVMKTVNIGENQSPEQESAVRRKALCRHGRRLYDKATTFMGERK